VVGKMPRFTGPIVRRDTSLGVHVRVLWCLYTDMIDYLPDVPDERRVQMRQRRKMLEDAYPEFLKLTPGDVQGALDEEDGIPQDF